METDYIGANIYLPVLRVRIILDTPYSSKEKIKEFYSSSKIKLMICFNAIHMGNFYKCRQKRRSKFEL